MYEREASAAIREENKITWKFFEFLKVLEITTTTTKPPITRIQEIPQKKEYTLNMAYDGDDVAGDGGKKQISLKFLSLLTTNTTHIYPFDESYYPLSFFNKTKIICISKFSQEHTYVLGTVGEMLITRNIYLLDLLKICSC